MSEKNVISEPMAAQQKLEGVELAGKEVPQVLVTPITTFDLNASPTHLLHRAQQMAADLHVGTFGPSGLTPRQVAVLAVLAARDGISQTDLVAKTGIDRSTLAEMVARMETKGLMIRTKSSTDSRANAVSLTEVGQQAYVEALPKLAAIDHDLLALLPSKARAALIDLLTRIAMPKTDALGRKALSVDKKGKKKDKKKKDKKKKG